MKGSDPEISKKNVKENRKGRDIAPAEAGARGGNPTKGNWEPSHTEIRVSPQSPRVPTDTRTQVVLKNKNASRDP